MGKYDIVTEENGRKVIYEMTKEERIEHEIQHVMLCTRYELLKEYNTESYEEACQGVRDWWENYV